jgi:hypothetical protein
MNSLNYFHFIYMPEIANFWLCIWNSAHSLHLSQMGFAMMQATSRVMSCMTGTEEATQKKSLNWLVVSGMWRRYVSRWLPPASKKKPPTENVTTKQDSRISFHLVKDDPLLT